MKFLFKIINMLSKPKTFKHEIITEINLLKKLATFFRSLCLLLPN